MTDHGQPKRPTIPILDAVTMSASAKQIMRETREAFEQLAAVPLADVTIENFLDQWDTIMADAENIFGPASILGSVHPDEEVRDAAEQVIVDAAAFQAELFQNEALFQRLNSIEPTTSAQKQLKKDLVESFEDSGVSLPAERRARVREIVEEAERLNIEFDKNVRDNRTQLTFTPDECRGLPQAWLDRVKRDENGNIVVGFDYPDYVPFMTNAENAEARKRYYVAYNNRGTEKNLEILDRIVALRKELASLYDLPSYAHYITRRHMAGSPDEVQKFLTEVGRAVSQAEVRDLDALREVKAKHTGEPLESTRIERWDHGFYAEKLRQQRFAIDQEQLRRFFPTQETVRWVLSVTERLYGVRLREAKVPVWHEDVVYYDLYDGDGAFMGGIYLDLFPRDGKYKHAAAWGVRGGSTRLGRTPISVLVCNFDRRGLTHNELETLFHEFGHVMHGVLSKTEYGTHSGTSVERDFVEAPSQMYEEWARKLESLKTLSNFAPDAPAIDAATVERLASARRFGRGINYARQHLYATFDMALAAERPRASLDVWKEMEGATPMGYVDATAFPGTFGHIAGDYAAGYYGYMWSEVLALDMLSAFGDDIMNESVGHRFRDTILSRGGEQPAREMVRNFLGREVDNRAFFAEIVGER